MNVPYSMAPLTLAALLLVGCVEQTGNRVTGGFPLLTQPDRPTEPAAYNRRAPRSGALVAANGEVEPLTIEATEPPRAAARRTTMPIVQNELGDYNLNFADVEVAELARVVLRDVLKVSYLIDERVKGRISIETPRPVPREALLPILESTLRSVGAGLVINDQWYEIVPLEEAARQFGALGTGSLGIVPVTLRYVAAETLRDVLAPFAQDLVTISIEPGQNLLILAGERNQLNNLISLVQSLDVNVLAGLSFDLTPLRNADAQVVARELESIFADSGGVRFLPIDRQNAILTMARGAELVSNAKAWIRTLDRRGGKNEPGIYIYQVESGTARELAATVSALFGLDGGNGQTTDLLQGDPLAPTLTPTRVADTAESAPPLTESASPLNGEVGNMPTDSGSLTDDPSLYSGQGGGGPASSALLPEPRVNAPAAYGSDKIRLVAHEGTNTIVVSATEEDWNRIETTLRRLDQTPLQILIEATVAEVTLNDQLRYGVQFALRSGNGIFSFSEGLDIVPDPVAQGFNFILDAGMDAQVVLDALSAITDLQVLTSPELMVASNRPARLQVGDQVPIVVENATPIDAVNNDVVIQTVEYRDTGVILNVTPHVNPSGLINLEIEQEVSDVVQTLSSGIDSPTISQRRVASTVAVEDGETVILGGLTSQSTSRIDSGIPGLRGIPVVGSLFGRTVNEAERTELLVMIRPRIIRDANDARAIAKELRERLGKIMAPDSLFSVPPSPSGAEPAPAPGPTATPRAAAQRDTRL